MSKSLDQLVREEALTAVANVGGNYEEFVRWNKILLAFGLEPIDSLVAKIVDAH